MSSLIVSHDLRVIMLEIAVENLFVSWNDVFDEALMKKTIIMFRMLDDEWTSLSPNRRDYKSYRGSNYENEKFYGGTSVVFAMPQIALEEKVSGVDVQFYVYKEVSKYFEMDSRQNFGFTLVRVDDLLNGIIKDLQERKELAGYFSSSLEGEPISRSTRGTHPLLDEDLQRTGATIELYIRISYLGKCVVTEMHTPCSIRKAFYAREDADAHYPYQFRELTRDELYSNRWGSATIIPPYHCDHLMCRCAEMEPEPELRRKRKRKKCTFAEDQAYLRHLLALLRQLKKGGGANVGIAEKPRKVCPAPYPSSSPCPPCAYSVPCGYCPDPSFAYSPTICPITCLNNS